MMEENKEIVEETGIPKEVTDGEVITPDAALVTGAPEKKPARQRRAAPKKTAAPKEIPEKTSVLRLKPSLRHGFQIRGRYYSRSELGRKSVLEKLYKQYPGLFEK